ncbi:MAG TPA: DUF885 domain-containing protein [Patescibacteria group bacterium]|nr:DUF885 domain-containing protein [Patescibacteria group bacterium]
MTTSTTLADLCARTWERTLELNPTMATIHGDERFDDRLDDPGPAGRSARRALAEEARAGALAIDPADLAEEDRISRELLALIAEQQIVEDELRDDLISAVDQNGRQSLLPQIVQVQRADTPERLERLLARIAAYPAMMGAQVDLLAEGSATGLTAARVVADRVVDQLERLLASPAAASPIVTVPRLADEADRSRLLAAVERHVRPADARYLEAVRSHLPAMREEPGLCALPDGEARYAAKVRAYTSLDVSPAELHRVGLAELETIEAERRAIARAAGHGDDTAAYRRGLNAEPAEIPPTPEALVARCQEDVERAFAAAPRWFSRLPKAGCEVRRVEPLLEKDAPGAYYYPPALDGSRPGIYFVNAYDLPSRTYWSAASTTYHEAVPGHHFQIALEMELRGLPAFRTLGHWPQGTAYVEGWALYTERVADEAGLFRSQAERFGMLDSQALRAVRLVVDTGLHALGWSRQKAFETMVAAGIHPTDAGIETDRYIAWPGQALAYMTGRREIERLRAARAAREGAAFDIRRFHDDVLRHGKLPLRILANVVLA